MNNTEEQINYTEEKNNVSENQITEQEKRALAIKWLESMRVDSDEEELMDAFNNQKELPWMCGK
jgi:hypothetical protein